MAKKIEKSDYCLDCGTHQGDSNYCPNCGQLNNARKPNVFELIREAVENLFAFDSRFYKTIGPLLFLPGKLSTRFVSGKRTRYVLPIRMFILSTFLLLAVISCNQNISKNNWYDVDYVEESNGNILTSFVTLTVDTTGIAPSKLDSLIENKWIYLDSSTDQYVVNPDNGYSNSMMWFLRGTKVAEFYQHAFHNKQQSVDSALVELNQEPSFWNHLLYSTTLKMSLVKGNDFINYINGNVLIILLLFIPTVALLMKGLYFNKRIYYVDHFVFATHVQTALFLYMTLLIVSYWFIQSDVLYFVYAFGVLTYIYLAIKRFYKQSWFMSAVKFIVLNLSLTVVFALFIVAVTMVSAILY